MKLHCLSRKTQSGERKGEGMEERDGGGEKEGRRGGREETFILY